MLGNVRPADSHSAIVLPPRPNHTPQPRVIRVVDDTGLLRETAYLSCKRCVDIVGGLLLAVILVPVIFVTGILVMATSPGAPFYTQLRLGRGGRPFVIWKIRTMTPNCEQQSGAAWSTKGDNRITTIGRVLRKLHIDEFPQLWNVLNGDMSLVGPRPERPEFFPVLSAAVPDYEKRLLMKPGVTGLAQTYLPPDEDITSVKLKQLHDLHYLRAVSFSLDLRLLIATTLQAGGVPHGLVRPLLWLPRSKSITAPLQTVERIAFQPTTEMIPDLKPS